MSNVPSNSVSSAGPGTPPFGESAVAVSEPVSAPAIQEYPSFEDMPIKEDLLRGLLTYGFDKPSPIQRKAIVPISKGHDFLGQAQSGTGKTGAYLAGIMNRIDPTKNAVQVVIGVPVRELASQIGDVAKGIGSFMNNRKGIRVHVATGGPPVREDLAVLQQSPLKEEHVPHILIATPGRLYDLLNRKAFNTNKVLSLVLDEADQMLDARFLEQVHCILSLTWPTSMQVVLMSATMIPELAAVAKRLLRNHVELLIPPEEVSLEGIKQWYVPMSNREEDKVDTLCDLFDHLAITQANIFVNTWQTAENLVGTMRKRGFDVDCTHGNMSKDERDEKMSKFRDGKIRVLISTDMLARGIDVQQVQLVLNYELPVQRENYIHRIGRAGRHGRKGASINFVSEREMMAQEEIVRFYGKKIRELPMDLDIY